MKALSLPPAIVELDREASALLDVLVELGHLDVRLLDRISDRLLDIDPPGGIIGAIDLRRVVSEELFDALEGLDEEQRRVIEDEWGFIFH